MTREDKARARRYQDQEIYVALLSGLSPEQVAARCGTSERNIKRARQRFERRLVELEPEQAFELLRRLSAWAAFHLAVEHFHRSYTDLEERTKASGTASGTDRRVERGTKKKLADWRFLRAALLALAELRAEPALGEDPAAGESAAALLQRAIHLRARYDQESAAGREHPDLYQAFLHARNELLCGQALEWPDFSHPKFRPLTWEDPA